MKNIQEQQESLKRAQAAEGQDLRKSSAEKKSGPVIEADFKVVN